MARVFLSYSRDDAERLAILSDDLKNLGHTAWIDKELTGGQRWWDHILQEIRDCDAFISAVSASSMDSRACLAEYEYAVALGKPILPVMVERGVADSLMPPHLAELHRVDYIAGDKAAFAALNRAMSTLPPPPALPDPLPTAPTVPASYLFDLKTEIDAPGVMAPEVQAQLVKELRSRLAAGHTHADVSALVQRFRQREDVLVRIDQELASLQTSLGQAAPGGVGGASPQPVRIAPVEPAPAAPIAAAPVAAAPPLAAAGGSVPIAWWAAPVFLGLIGGTVAFFAVRGANPATARNMFIVGAVMSVVWAALLS
jgi:hypothetical protein